MAQSMLTHSWYLYVFVEQVMRKQRLGTRMRDAGALSGGKHSYPSTGCYQFRTQSINLCPQSTLHQVSLRISSWTSAGFALIVQLNKLTNY